MMRLILSPKIIQNLEDLCGETTRANVANVIKGVSEGFTKIMELNGVGYRAQVQGNKVVLNLGYSHPVEMIIP